MTPELRSDQNHSVVDHKSERQGRGRWVRTPFLCVLVECENRLSLFKPEMRCGNLKILEGNHEAKLHTSALSAPPSQYASIPAPPSHPYPLFLLVLPPLNTRHSYRTITNRSLSTIGTGSTAAATDSRPPPSPPPALH